MWLNGLILLTILAFANCIEPELAVEAAFQDKISTDNHTIFVQLKQGNIIGEKNILPSGQNHYKFFGIPYAKPPLGELRFNSPQTFENFPDDPLDCRIERGISLQIQMTDNQILGTEDCLYLNIHAPCISGENLIPVMVWIHGGGFLTGSGNKHILCPQYILENNVILVTVNYRLGMFGFLSYPSGGISGNYGLKDQLMAFKWIHENIESFNGDKNNVTLIGQSAGAACVHFHLLSEKSKKYFQRVILHSGSSINEWSIENNPEEKALKLAKLFKFKGKSKNIAKSFRSLKNPYEQFKYIFNTLSDDEKRRIFILPFRPVIESEDSEDSFITKHPFELLKTENIFGNKSIISGYTSKEGMIVIGFIKGISEIDNDLVSVLPYAICQDLNNPNNIDMSKEIREFYLNGNNIKFDKQKISELCDLLGDTNFIVPFYWTSELHLEYQPQSPLYCFKFDYDGNCSYNKKRFNVNHMHGVCHGDDLFYLFFPNTELESSSKSKSNSDSSQSCCLHDDSSQSVCCVHDDIKFIKKFCKLWTNFAKYNDPTPQNEIIDNDLIDFKWEPTKIVKKENKYVLDILVLNKNFEIVQDPDHNRIEFWRNFASKHNSNLLSLNI